MICVLDCVTLQFVAVNDSVVAGGGARAVYDAVTATAVGSNVGRTPGPGPKLTPVRTTGWPPRVSRPPVGANAEIIGGAYDRPAANTADAWPATASCSE